MKNKEGISMNDKSLRVLMIEDSEDDALLIIREIKKGGCNPVPPICMMMLNTLFL